MTRKQNSDFITGLVLGSMVGAAIGIAFTPRRGDEVRDSLMERWIELKDRATDLSSRARHKFQTEEPHQHVEVKI